MCKKEMTSHMGPFLNKPELRFSDLLMKRTGLRWGLRQTGGDKMQRSEGRSKGKLIWPADSVQK